jgi:hypothetical protein
VGFFQGDMWPAGSASRAQKGRIGTISVVEVVDELRDHDGRIATPRQAAGVERRRKNERLIK